MTLVKVEEKRLLQLEKKERAHDDYLEAMRRLREASAWAALRDEGVAVVGFSRGYAGALRDLTQFIVDVANERTPEA